MTSSKLNWGREGNIICWSSLVYLPEPNRARERDEKSQSHGRQRQAHAHMQAPSIRGKTGSQPQRSSCIKVQTAHRHDSVESAEARSTKKETLTQVILSLHAQCHIHSTGQSAFCKFPCRAPVFFPASTSPLVRFESSPCVRPHVTDPAYRKYRKGRERKGCHSSPLAASHSPPSDRFDLSIFYLHESEVNEETWLRIAADRIDGDCCLRRARHILSHSFTEERCLVDSLTTDHDGAHSALCTWRAHSQAAEFCTDGINVLVGFRALIVLSFHRWVY